ncbi:MAG: hypothetical protein ACO3EZ_08305 [Prochlorotrichaceae cyanobacterium]
MSPQGIFILIFFTVVVLSVMWARKSSPRQQNPFRGGISRELLQATKGDRELAERLMNYARNKYPGKSERWYLEKVLYDLERDGAGGASSAREFRRNRQGPRKSSPFSQWWQRLFRR